MHIVVQFPSKTIAKSNSVFKKYTMRITGAFLRPAWTGQRHRSHPGSAPESTRPHREQGCADW